MRYIWGLLICLFVVASVSAQSASRTMGPYLKVRTTDSLAVIYSPSKDDSMIINWDGTDFTIDALSDTFWIDNHLTYLGNVDSSGGNVVLVFKNAVDSFALRLNSGGNGQYTNDFSTWSDIGTGGGGGGGSAEVTVDGSAFQDSLIVLDFGTDFDLDSSASGDTTYVTLESHLEVGVDNSDSLGGVAYIAGSDTLRGVAYIGDQADTTRIALGIILPKGWIGEANADSALITKGYADGLSTDWSNIGDTVYVYALALNGSNSPTATINWGAQDLVNLDSLALTKIKLAANSVLTDLTGGSNSGLTITSGNLLVRSLNNNNYTAQSVNKTTIDTADNYVMNGLNINIKESSWAFRVLSSGGETVGFNGIAVLDTIADSVVGVYLYADDVGGTQRSASMHLVPSGGKQFVDFRTPVAADHGDTTAVNAYSRFRIYGDSVLSFEPIYVKDNFDVTGNITVSGTVDTVDVAALGATVPKIIDDTTIWNTVATAFDTNYTSLTAGGQTINDDTSIVSEGELEDSLDTYLLSATASSTYETITNVGKIGDDTTNTKKAWDSVNAWGNVRYDIDNNVLSDNPHVAGDMTVDGRILQTGVYGTFDMDYIHAEIPDSPLYTVPIYYWDGVTVKSTEPFDSVFYNDSANITHCDVEYFPGPGWPKSGFHSSDSSIWYSKNWWMIYTPYGACKCGARADTVENPHIAWSDDGIHWYRPWKDSVYNDGSDTTRIWANQPICPLSEAQAVMDSAKYQADPCMMRYSDNKMYAYWLVICDSTTGGDLETHSYLVVKSSTNGVGWSSIDTIARYSDNDYSNQMISPAAIMGNYDSVFIYGVMKNASAYAHSSANIWRFTQSHPESTFVDSSKLFFIDSIFTGNQRYVNDTIYAYSDTIYDTTGLIPIKEQYCNPDNDSCEDYGWIWHTGISRFEGEYHFFASDRDYDSGSGTATYTEGLGFWKSSDGLKWEKANDWILRAGKYRNDDPTGVDSLVDWAWKEIYKPGPVLRYSNMHGWYYQVYLGCIGYTVKNDVQSCTNDTGVAHHTGIVNVFFNANDYETKQFAEFSPDQINDTLSVFYVDPDQYPDGIRLVKAWALMDDSSHAASYSVTLEEFYSYTAPTRSKWIDTLTITSDSCYTESETFSHSLIEAGNYIRLGVPSTDVVIIGGGIRFYRRDLNYEP